MKISIITTISNEVNKIKFTMDSVMLQSYKNYEHIIIYNDIDEDALKFVSTYSKNTILFYFQNSNLFQMLNKGIKYSTGDIILFLDENSYLANIDTLQSIVNIFKREDIDGLLSSIVYLNDTQFFKVNGYFHVSKFSREWFKLGGYIPYSSFILKNDIYNKYGMFDKNFKILADYEFALRLTLKNKIKLEPIKQVLFYNFDNYNRKNLLYINYDISDEYRLAWMKNNLNYSYMTKLLKYLRQYVRYIFVYISPKWLSHMPPSEDKSSYLNKTLAKVMEI
jgi:glycosyltransferase